MEREYYNAFWSSTYFKKRRAQIEGLEELFAHLRKKRFWQKAD